METKARTMKREGRKPQVTAEPVAVRLSKWSVELPELAQFLTSNQTRYTKSEHSTQYWTFVTDTTFVEALRGLAQREQQRYQKLAREQKSGR